MQTMKCVTVFALAFTAVSSMPVEVGQIYQIKADAAKNAYNQAISLHEGIKKRAEESKLAVSFDHSNSMTD